MREYFSNKPIFIITCGKNFDKIYSLTRFENEYDVKTAVNAAKLSNITASINEVTSIPDHAALYFHETSCFPRHKLEITSFKRKIKIEKADYLVGNFETSACKQVTFHHMWETDSCIYVSIYDCVYPEVLKMELDIDLSNISDQGTGCFKLINTKEDLFYTDLLTGKYNIPVISDKSLNNIVDNKCDNLTIEDVKSLISLVESSDLENRNLALKLFVQFNLNNLPAFAYTFLSVYNRKFSGINSVVYTNVKKRFKPMRYASTYELFNHLAKIETSIEDKTFASIVLKQYPLHTYYIDKFKNIGYL